MCSTSRLPTFHWPELSHKTLPKCKRTAGQPRPSCNNPTMDGEQNSSAQPAFLPHKQKVCGGSQPHPCISITGGALQKCMCLGPSPRDSDLVGVDQCLGKSVFLYILKNILFNFIFRERGREGEREGEKHQCVRESSIGCLSYTPNWGPGLQPGHVPLQEIKPVTGKATICIVGTQSTEPHLPGQKSEFLKAQPGLRVTGIFWSIHSWHYLSTTFKIISQIFQCEQCSLPGFSFVSAGKIVFTILNLNQD